LYFGVGNGMSCFPRQAGLNQRRPFPLGKARSFCALSSKKSIVRKYWGEAAPPRAASQIVVFQSARMVLAWRIIQSYWEQKYFRLLASA
jgi:hypothetical protein